MICLFICLVIGYQFIKCISTVIRYLSRYVTIRTLTAFSNRWIENEWDQTRDEEQLLVHSTMTPILHSRASISTFATKISAFMWLLIINCVKNNFGQPRTKQRYHVESFSYCDYNCENILKFVVSNFVNKATSIVEYVHTVVCPTVMHKLQYNGLVVASVKHTNSEM